MKHLDGTCITICIVVMLQHLRHMHTEINANPFEQTGDFLC